MSVGIVVGGQYGGEGKGKIVSYLALCDNPDVVAKSSGPNCRHRIYLHDGTSYDLRLLPASVIAGKGRMIFGAGSLIHVETLFSEMNYFHCHDRVAVDYRAGVITDSIVRAQRALPHYQAIGTTYSGTGLASAERSLRRLTLAKEHPRIQPYLNDVPAEIHNVIRAGKSVLVEGGQSFWLSNYHGDYPYVTSRDTTAAAFASQIGIGLKYVTDIILVVKCFPTRNSSGRLPREIKNMNNHPAMCMREGVEGLGQDERTTQRRIGTFCLEDVSRSAMVNSATQVALTGVDVYDPSCANSRNKKQLTSRVRGLLEEIEDGVQVPVTLVSTGPHPYDTIDMRE